MRFARQWRRLSRIEGPRADAFDDDESDEDTGAELDGPDLIDTETAAREA